MFYQKKYKNAMYKNFVLAGIVFVTSSFCFIYFSFFVVYAAPDQELTYHGKLTDTLGLAVSNGTYSFTLTIYDDATGTGCLWTARGTCSSPIPKSLTVTDGVFTTTLGESGDNVLDIDFSTNYYLGVTIDSNTEMTPRRKITPTGFALNANRLDGLTADNYIDTSAIAQAKQGDLTINGNLTVDGVIHDSNGQAGTNGQILSTTASGTDWVDAPVGGSTTFLGLTDTPASYTANQYVRVNATGTGLEFVAFPTESDTLDAVTTRGDTTTNHITAGGLTVEDDEAQLHINSGSDPSQINFNTNLTTVDQSIASIDFSSNSSEYARIATNIYQSSSNGSLDFYIRNDGVWATEAMRIAGGENGPFIGMGTFTPSQRLHVNGNMRLTGSLYDSNNDSGIAGQILSATASGTDWINAPVGGSATFLGLTDTPSSYTANQYVRVNSAGTALEFVDLPVDADTLGSLMCSSGQVAQWDGSNWVCVAMSGGGMAIGGAITSATAGSILFAGTSGVLQQDNTNFFWDDTNNRLGLGTSTPSAMFSIFGTNNKLRLSYDAANYADISVDNAGQLTMNASSAAESAMVIGTGIAQDTSIQFDGISHDYFSGIDDATGLYTIGVGTSVAASAILTGPGTVANAAGGTTVTGTNTKFLSTFRIGNTITIGSQTVAISAIASDTSMTTAAITAANSGATYTYSGGTKLSVEPSGNIGIGKADPEYALDVLGTGTTGVIARFNSTNATGCTLATNGTISCSSDERLKKNINDLNYGIGTIMSLRPTSYNWNYENGGSMQSFGFIAQEVERVLPQLVVTDLDSGYKQLNTIGLVPILTRAVQDQQHLIETHANVLTTKATATSLLDLQRMTDAQFTEVSVMLDQIHNNMLVVQEEANKIADIELDATFTQANVSIFNTLFNIDPTDGSEEASAYITDLAINMQKILAIDPDQLVMKNHVGDVSIAGIMTVDTVIADEVETTKLTIVDDKNETIGIAVICPEKNILINDLCEEVTDENSDQSDGKSVKVISDAINDHTTIFTSFESDPGASSWIEKERDEDGNFIGFTIKLGDAVEKAVKINWWIVEMK